MQIAILLFAILSLTGAWAAWRRSPLYSHQTTLKLVAVYLVIVGVILSATPAIMGGDLAHSPVTQAILIGLLIIGVGIGATAGIIRITDSHLAKLPLQARIVTTERHKVQRWIWRSAAYLAISGAALLVIPSGWSWLPGVPALLVLLGAGPMLTGFYMRARRLDLGLSQILAAPWVRWQYTPVEWQAWAQSQLEWERQKQGGIAWARDWRKLLMGTLLFSWVFAGSAWMMVSGSTSDKLRSATLGEGLLIAIVALISLANRGVPERRYRRQLAAPREAIFGEEGLYSNGQFSPWILSGSYLVEATAPHGPPARLEMTFREANGSSTTLVSRRVPIPAGREGDVAAIQQGLRKCCPKAAVRLGA